ncbi:MAG: CfrBI family restriction endonuclease [Acidobacteriota bacterium]|nr:CfrBI family restriction endonuclease [Acidobacteriota bacterium]
MTLTDEVTKRIITRLVSGQDYRIEVVSLINTKFLEYAIEFFRRVIEAKSKHEPVTVDWYKQEFLNPDLPSDELIINSGLNKKTISNMYNSASRNIVLQATSEHYEQLYSSIANLIEQEEDFDLTLTIRFGDAKVDLTLSESLIVINTLAVKRAELRGGAWSTAGKQVEKSLMKTLCLLYKVPESHYDLTGLTDSQREVDFYLIGRDQTRYRCEVKLMGKGNPESADAIFARESQVFVADKLSDLNKQQADKLKVKWVELRSPNGHQKFKAILDELNVPNGDFQGSIDQQLTEVFSEIFK